MYNFDELLKQYGQNGRYRRVLGVSSKDDITATPVDATTTPVNTAPVEKITPQVNDDRSYTIQDRSVAELSQLINSTKDPAELNKLMTRLRDDNIKLASDRIGQNSVYVPRVFSEKMPLPPMPSKETEELNKRIMDAEFDKQGQTVATNENLKDAIARDNSVRGVGSIADAISQIGGGIAGLGANAVIRPTLGSAKTAENLATNEKNLASLISNEENDPNSAASINKRKILGPALLNLGIDPSKFENLSAKQLDDMMNMVIRQSEGKENREQRLYERQLAAYNQRAMRHAQEESRREALQQRSNFKQETLDRGVKRVIDNKIKNVLDAKGNSFIGSLQFTKAAAERLFKVVEAIDLPSRDPNTYERVKEGIRNKKTGVVYKDGDKNLQIQQLRYLGPQALRELATAFDRVIKGGPAAVTSTEHLSVKTIKNRINELKIYLGKLPGALDEKTAQYIYSTFLGTIKTELENANTEINKRLTQQMQDVASDVDVLRSPKLLGYASGAILNAKNTVGHKMEMGLDTLLDIQTKISRERDPEKRKELEEFYNLEEKRLRGEVLNLTQDQEETQE